MRTRKAAPKNALLFFSSKSAQGSHNWNFGIDCCQNNEKVSLSKFLTIDLLGYVKARFSRIGIKVYLTCLVWCLRKYQFFTDTVYSVIHTFVHSFGNKRPTSWWKGKADKVLLFVPIRC